jgi:large conductance mechanosensitive channel
MPDNKQSLIGEFTAFIQRGNLIELAVAFVIAAAFKDVINALVKDLITPIVSIPGKTNFADLSFSIRSSVFAYGDFINFLITFLITAAAVFLFVVKPMNAFAARRGRPSEPKDCPECLTAIPTAAKRCSACGSPQPQAA